MKYFIGQGNEYKEVSKEEYVIAEREAGFYNTLGYPDEPATSAFVGLFGIRGYTEFESLADFNVPQDRELIGYAMHDAREGEVAEVHVVEEE